MIAARLQAYTPNGAPLGELPYPLTIDPMVAHNDVGSLTFSYSNLAAGGAHLATALQSGLEVALELSKGEKDVLGRDVWVEPKGCRFVRLEDDSDPSDPTKRVSLTLPSFGWLLARCVVGAAGAVDNIRTFTAPTVGEILLALLDENVDRDGYATSVVPTFTETTDSAGTAWPVLPDMRFNVGDDYLTVLDGLMAAGACDWTTQARGLYCYVPDSPTLSLDLSGTDGVTLTLGTDIAGAPTKRSIANMAGRVLVMAAAGGVTMAEEPTATTGWGIPETTLRIGQVAGESAGIAAGQAHLEQVGRPQGQFTRELVLGEATHVPLMDYWPGCWIMAPGAAGAGEKLRVQQATLSFKGIDSTGALTLNDLMLEQEERRARTLASLAGGTISPGGPPAPIAVDPEASRVPSTPTGLETTAAVVFQGTTPRGVVTAVWNPVTTGTDTGALTISGYELQWRIGAGAWQAIRTAELSAQIGNLTPGDSIETRVRAIGARTTLPSAWSTVDTVLVPGDVTPPSVPTAPTTASALMIVSVTWAGTLAAAIPADFARVEVAVGTTSTPTTVCGALTRGGALQVTAQTLGVAIGDTVWARLRSVDTTGNVSAYSAAVSVVVAGVKGPDLEANSVTANTIAVGALDFKIANGMELVAPDIKTATSGARVEINPTGSYWYNSAGTQTVSIVGGTATITGGTVTGALVRTAASGARADMANLTGGGGFWARDSTGAARATMQVSDTVSPGIYLWDSAGTSRVFLYTSGTTSVMSFRNPANAEVMKITDGQIKIFSGGQFVAEHINGQVALQAGPIGPSWGLLVNKDNGNPVMRVYQTSGDSGRIFVGHENQNILTMQVWATGVWFGQNDSIPGTGSAMTDFVINTDEFYLYNAGGTLIHGWRSSGSTRISLGDTTDPLANFWLYAAESQIRNHSTLFFIDGSDVTTGSIDRAGAGALRVAGGNGAMLTLGAGANFVSANGNTVTLDNTNLRSATVYSNTTTGAANVVVVTTSGVLMRSTSLRAAKLDIEDAPAAWADLALALRPRTWLDRSNVERYADALTAQDEGEQVDWELEHILRIDERTPGFVAEEVLAAGGDVFISRDEMGAAAGLAYERLTAALVVLAQRQQQQIDSLTARITTLEGDNP
ncbi:hypothetical protein [Promicromonospora sp. NFX87]|uniref:hypothetical protein n=1 Tax=Promicromonospora sp. NFX87 TaxID=3402691 RepID=UPI003AFB63F5